MPNLLRSEAQRSQTRPPLGARPPAEQCEAARGTSGQVAGREHRDDFLVYHKLSVVSVISVNKQYHAN